MRKIIIDTDIGNDIDDTWAISLILSCNFFDVKLISVSEEDTDYKVKLIAKILKELNREDIPIAKGIGIVHDYSINAQERYLSNFKISEYTGKIYSTYEEAYSEVLKNNKEITVVALSPYTSLVEVIPLLKKYNTKIIAMSGSYQRGYFDNEEISPECNIVTNVDASRAILNSNLDYTMLPLDVCNNLIIDGDSYQKIIKSTSVFAKMVMENYKIWNEDYLGGAKKYDYEVSSTILYDIAPVLYMLFPQNFSTDFVNINVDDEGYTKTDIGKSHVIAYDIKNIQSMIDFTVNAITNSKTDNKSIAIGSEEKDYTLIFTNYKGNSELAVVETGWQKCKSGYSYGPTKRDYYILHCIVNGEGKYVIGDKTYHLKENDCFLIPPNVNTFYQADYKNPWTYYWVGFMGLETKYILKQIGFLENNVYALTTINSDIIIQKFKNLVDVNERNLATGWTMLGNLYLMFSEMIHDKNIVSEIEGKDFVRAAINYINENYMKKIKIEDMANSIFIDRTYLYRLFVDALDYSPQDYLINVRMNKALILLKDTKMKLIDVALEVGYENYTNFSRIFKKRYNVTPGEYRKNPFENIEGDPND